MQLLCGFARFGFSLETEGSLLLVSMHVSDAGHSQT